MSTTSTSGCADPGARTGVLLANLGTPASPAPADVRRYLAEFLADPMVIRTNRLLWWAVLHGIILPLRSGKSAELYRRIWTPQGSPLLVHSRAQVDALSRRLGPTVPVALGMRYGHPSLDEGLEELRAKGCTSFRLLPMFPQASGTTTGTLVAAWRAALERAGGFPHAEVPPFHSHPAYLRALADAVRDHVGAAGPLHHVFSFHGLPASYVRDGDPYLEHCRATAAGLAHELGLAEGRWTLAFQSRFGPAEWLQPYLEPLLVELAREHPRLVVVTPGFLADCLETLEEVGIRARGRFLAAGGRELLVVPCLNSRPAFVDALEELVRAGLGSHVPDRVGPASGSGGRT